MILLTRQELDKIGYHIPDFGTIIAQSQLDKINDAVEEMGYRNVSTILNADHYNGFLYCRQQILNMLSEK